MRLLLDTQALIWWLDAPERLARPAHDGIADPANVVYLSAVVAWEMAIKLRTGRLRVRPDLERWLPAQVEQHRFTQLSVDLSHAVQVEHLPLHHRDPFDRLLIAQAQVEQLTLITADRRLSAYGVPILWT